MNKMELLHYSLSGKIDEYDFDYDEAFAKVISSFTKVEEIDLPKDSKRNFKTLSRNWV